MPSLALGAPRPPKLVLFVVVDQFRADYLDRLSRKGPLALRLAKATIYTNVHHDHVPTTTSPGHAAIATGRPPAINGIAGNDIFDRETRALSSAVEDKSRTAGPFRLKAMTLADAVKTGNPASRVISVSLKDRSAILLGGRRPDAVVWFDKTRQRFVTSSYYGTMRKWAEDENEDVPALLKSVTPPFDENDFISSPEADNAVVALSTRAIAAEKLGEDDACDLLLVSLSATDNIGHRWGPDSPQMSKQLKALEKNIHALISSAEAAAGKQLIVVITSDHGVLNVPESPEGRKVGARRIAVSDLIDSLEAAIQAIYPAKGKKWITGVQGPDIYLNQSLALSQKFSWPQFVQDAAEALRQVPDVAAVYVPGAKSNDPYAAVFKRSWLEGVSGDLQFRTPPNTLIARWPTGTSHGSPYDYDAVVPAILMGTAGKPGRIARPVSVEALSPTIAILLGVALPPGESGLLSETLPAASH